MLAEPLWLPVISHLFPNLCVQEPPWSHAMWQRSEGAAGPLSQHRARPGYTPTQQANAHTHRHTQASEGAAGCGSTCTPAGWSHITDTHTHELRCAGAIKQVLQGKRVQQRAHKSGTNTSGKKKRGQSRDKKKRKMHRRGAGKRLRTQRMTGKIDAGRKPCKSVLCPHLHGVVSAAQRVGLSGRSFVLLRSVSSNTHGIQRCFTVQVMVGCQLLEMEIGDAGRRDARI